METIKYFEVRDRGTNLSVCCVDMGGEGRSKADHGVLAHAGFCPEVRCILYTKLSGYDSKYRITEKADDADERSRYDLYGWGDRTNSTAHRYIHDNWDELESGALIDVQWVLGESKSKKTSENTSENFGLKPKLNTGAKQ